MFPGRYYLGMETSDSMSRTYETWSDIICHIKVRSRDPPWKSISWAYGPNGVLDPQRDREYARRNERLRARLRFAVNAARRRDNGAAVTA
jgi:hypothetical protein